MTLWLGALATYVFLPACLYAGLARLVRPTAGDAPALAAVSLGLAPLGASWLLTGLLTILPGQAVGVYITLVLAAFGLIGGLGLARRPPWPFARPDLGPAKPFLIVSAALCLLLAATAMVLPLNGNDPLEYALVAKAVSHARSLANYPLRQADPVTGLYAGSSHPLGYVSLILWTYLFSGDAFGWLSKSLSPFYTLATLVLFLAGRRRDHWLHGSLAGLLLLGASLYYQTSAICHIDSLRLYALYLSLFCLDRIPDAPASRSWPWIGLTGAATGASLFCHSIGLLTLPFVGACWLLRSRRPIAHRLAVAAVICALGLALGGGRYVRNMLDYGAPVRDDEPVWSLPSVDYTGYNDRLKTITSPADRMLNGVLTPLTRYNGPTDNALIFFGLSFWLALAALARPRKVAADPMAVSCLVCLGLFFGLALASVLAGSSLIIKNVRYFLTVLPFAAYVGAIPLASLAERAARLRPLGRLAADAGLVAAACGVTLLMAGANLAFALPNLGRLAQNDLAFLRHTYGGEYFYPAGYDAVAWVRENTPADARILVFRKNEMAFYGNRRILADTDPALLPFYAATDPDAAVNVLRGLGVGYIFTPNYLPPTFTNSMAAILADDPSRCELVFSRKGYKVYRLRAAPAVVTAEPLPAPTVWSRPASFVPSFFTEALAPLAPFRAPATACGQVVSSDTVAVTPQGAYSGPGPLDLPPSACLASSPIQGGAAYRFTATASGPGWLKVFLLFYLKGGGLTWDVLYDGVPRGPSTAIVRQVLAPTDAWQYRLLFVTGPRDSLTVAEPRLERLGKAPRAAGPERTVFAADVDLAARQSAPAWVEPGNAPGPEVLARARQARRAALADAADRQADGETVLGVVAGFLARAKDRTAPDPDTVFGRLDIAVSGQGRVECFVTWNGEDGGARVAYAGAAAPCGGSGRASLPVALPHALRDARPLFKLEPDTGEVTVRHARIQAPPPAPSGAASAPEAPEP